MAGTTHTVTNQPPPLTGYDVYAADRALKEAVERHIHPDLLDEVHGELGALGRACGSAQVQEWGLQANENPPRLRTHDRHGHRVDEVEFHPAWHRVLGKGVSAAGPAPADTYGERRPSCCGRRSTPATAARCR